MKLFGSLKELVAAVFRKDSVEITLRPNQSSTYGGATDIQLPEDTATTQELVGKDSTQTLTNKTLDNTNTLSITDSNLTIEGTTADANFNSDSLSTNRIFTFPDKSMTFADNQDLTDHVADTSTHGVSGNILGTTDSQSMSNKSITSSTMTISDSGFTIEDAGDPTKKAQFDAGLITPSTTRTIQLPNADTTLVGDDSSQTLTNKAIEIDDNAFTVQDNVDNTKKVQFDASGVTTATTRTLQVPDANTTLVGDDSSQTLTNKTIDADNNTISNLAHGAEVDNPSSGVHGVTGSVVGTTDVQELTNKIFESGTSTFRDNSSNQRRINIDPSGSSNSTITTIRSNSTVSRTIELPDAADTLVGRATTDTLTNKDIDGGTASNTNRITLPKDSKANLDGLTRKEGTIVYASDENKVYADNGSTLVEIGSGGGGGGLTLANVSTSITVSANTHYLVDSSGGELTLTLPAGSSGAIIRFSDVNNAWTSYNLTIQAAGGETINGDNQLIMDVGNIWVQLMWDGTEWKTDDPIDPAIDGLSTEIITDWQSFTVTGGHTTSVTHTGYYRRVGSNMQIRVNSSFTGATNNTSFLVDIPNGLTIDTTVNGGILAPIGNFIAYDGGTVANIGIVTRNTATQIVARYFTDDGTEEKTDTVNLALAKPLNAANGTTAHLECEIPIAEWAGELSTIAYNKVGYYSNDGSNDILSPDGSLVPNVSLGTPATRTFTVGTRQSNEVPILQVKTASGEWIPAETLYPRSLQAGNNYGMSLFYATDTTMSVYFGKGGYRSDNAVYGNNSASSSWSSLNSSGVRWRVVFSSNPLGIGTALHSSTAPGAISPDAQTIYGTKTFDGNVEVTGILDQNNTFALAQHKRMLINQGGVADSYEYTISVDSNNTPSTVKELDLQVAQGAGNNYTYIEIEMYFAGTSGQGKAMFHTYITSNTFGAVTLADSWSANSFDATDYGSIAWVNTGTDTNKLQWTTGSSSGRAYALFKIRIVRRGSSIITVL